jgi:uncharacterized protein (DUF488 family)
MNPTLYTIGYERQSIQAYIAALTRAGVTVVVDVRLTAWSYRRDFSKTSLTQALALAGIAYFHADFAGNPKEIRMSARTHAECLIAFSEYLDEADYVLDLLDVLLGDLHCAGETVCLTCYERHPDDCHRGILASRWAATRPVRVEHLEADGLPRRAPEWGMSQQHKLFL